jgi:hypothetical protein
MLDILHSLGRYAKLLHSIPTEGFGSVFDWSRNEISQQMGFFYSGRETDNSTVKFILFSVQ